MIRTILLQFDGAGGAYSIEFPKRVKLLKLSGVLPQDSSIKFKTDDIAYYYVDATGVNYPLGYQGYTNLGCPTSVYIEHFFEGWNVLGFGWVDGGTGIPFNMILTFDDYE